MQLTGANMEGGTFVMPPRLLFNELTREELRTAAPETMVVLPLGSTEQHGPHLPVGTDAFIVEHVARAAATDAGARIPVLVTPPLNFGSSHHHVPFGGTMSVGTETYYRLLVDLLESLIASCFRRIFILNGHGGNHELAELVARDLTLRHAVHIAAGSYWRIAWEALVGAGAHERGQLPGHAGGFETSIVLALLPELLRQPLPHRNGVTVGGPPEMVRLYRAEAHGRWQRIDGYTDSPDRADAASGQAYLRAVVRAVAQALEEFYATTIRVPGAQE